MADNPTGANPFARYTQRRMTAETAIGMNALKPIVQFQVSMLRMWVQVSMLRMWADSIERFAGNYEKALDETATAVEEQPDQKRAA